MKFLAVTPLANKFMDRLPVRLTCFGLLAISLFLFPSCGDDSSPVDIGDSVFIPPDTPEEFIERLVSAYNRRDLDSYAALLHEDFVFEGFDPDSPKAPMNWNRNRELAIARNMFEGSETLDGRTVQSINLDLNVKFLEEIESDDPDETWYSVLLAVDLKVFALNQGEDGFTNYIVFSDAEFILRQNSEGNVSAGRQIDHGSIDGKRNDSGATEEFTWTAVKSVFRWSKADVNAYFGTFASSYSQRDSVSYSSLLADSYTFELLDEDPDDTEPPQFWDLAEELVITGRMFSGWENPAGATVQTIRLTIDPRSIDLLSDPDEAGPGEITLRVLARINMDVSVIDQGGNGFTRYIVFSDQDWTLHAAPGGDLAATNQTDREPIAKSTMPGATEESSWGAVKGLFR